MQQKAKKDKFKFPYLQDDLQVAGKYFNAKNTPEAFVIWKENNEWVIKYDGAIDDNGADPLLVTQKYVEDAVNSLLKGKKVKIMSEEEEAEWEAGGDPCQVVFKIKEI